jgi:hypothetical protein
MGVVMQMSAMKVILFNNTDFTNYAGQSRTTASVFSEGSGGLNVTFDIATNEFFRNQTRSYSMILQGALRFDNSTFYNLTFETNLKMEVYFDGEHVISKKTLTNESVVLEDWYLENNRFYDWDIFLVDDQEDQ